VPRYIYRCVECMSAQTYVHSMDSILGRADKCKACGAAGSLTREPSLFTTKSDRPKIKKKTGDLVKEFIEEAKESVSKEKEIYKMDQDI